MARLRNFAFSVIVSASTLLAPAAVQAQTAAPPGNVEAQRGSWWPATGRSYLGLSLGRSQYRTPCAGAAFVCDDSARSLRLSAGAMMGNYWGVEIGYLNMGRIARAGGETRAQGLNLSLVGKAPISQSFGVFGKIGPTWGRTETSAVAGSGVVSGTERGFGLSYGAGVSYDITPRLSATLEWESTDFRFAGGVRDPVRSTSLGLQYRY